MKLWEDIKEEKRMGIKTPFSLDSTSTFWEFAKGTNKFLGT